MDGEEIYRNMKNAVVTVKSVTSVQVKLNGDNVFDDTLVATLSGFFVKDHYIVTAGHGVLFQPLSYTSISGLITVDRNPPSNGDITRVQRIFVTVYHVNDSDDNVIYEADLVGVDGAGDVAVLKLNYKREWNKHLPKVKCTHPYFNWTDSRKCVPGSTVYIIGDPLGEDPHSIISGTVRNNRNVQFAANVLAESLTTDAHINPGNSGSPIINDQSCVVGLVTYSEFYFDTNVLVEADAETGGGPSQYFIQHVVCSLIEASKYDSKLRLVNDVFGDFYKYIKGFMGLSWIVKTEPVPVPLIGNVSDFNKMVVGLVIDYIDAGSPFLNTLNVGDIITHIDSEKCDDGKKVLGQVPPQITPTLVTWKSEPGSSITLYYRKVSEDYITRYSKMADLEEFPPQYDYSFVGIASTPYIGTNGNTVTYTDMINAVNLVIASKNLNGTVTLADFTPKYVIG